MLSGSNDEKLANKKVDSKVVPLYQVWQELVHVQTLDVYQYRVLRITVDAKDIYSASHIAISKLATVLNLASFYNLVDAWDLKSVVIVTINN